MGKPKKKFSSLTKRNYKRRTKCPMNLNSVDAVAADYVQNEDCETNTLKKKSKLGKNAIRNDFFYEKDNTNGNKNNNEETLQNNILLPGNFPLDSTFETFEESWNGEHMEGKTEDEEVGCELVLENLKSQLCRVCGRKQESFLPIFGTQLENEDAISEKIQMYLPVEIKADDDLPHNICKNCNATLLAWHDLHVSCVAADRVLRRTFTNNNTNEGGLDNLDKSLGYVMDQPQENSFTTSAKRESEVQGQSMEKFQDCKKVRADNASDSCQIKCCSSYKYFEKVKNKHYNCESQQAVCEFCGICVKQPNLRNHVLKVHTKTILCETCGKFFSWYNFKTHRGVCVLDPIRYCELCSRVFLTETGYEVHMQEHEQGINQILNMKIKAGIQDELSLVYYCPVCGASYQDKISVIVHLNKKKIVTCRPCNKVFTNERAFLTHIHMPNQTFWHCRYCFQTFKRKYSWKIHERTHSQNNRLYCCEMCRKQYPSLESLLQHILCHGLNNYFCAQCNVKFRRLSSLKEHVLHHEGFVYKCKSCMRQFQSSHSLRLHKTKVHGNGILLKKLKT